MEGMSINNLPIELLEHIISFLSPSERLKSTLISRRFAQAFNQSPMNDIWLVVRADLIDEAEAIISNSTRQYKNIRICKADPLEFNSIIWTKLGISLRQLEFVACRYGSSGVLYNILHACPSLESLVIRELWVEEVLNVSDESEMNVSMMSRFFEEPENVPLSNEAIMPIFELTKLRELRLDLYLTTQHDDRPVEDFVRGLGQLSSLECLHLSHGIGLIGHTCLQNLATLPNLQDLLLDHLEWDANCLRTITFDFKNLRRLSINSIIGGRLVDFQESERKVLDVAINSGSDPRGERIKSSRLETLEMCGVPLTDVGLACIATHHSKLKILRLAMCDKITDAGVVNLHKQQPLLEELWICDCPSINGSFLRALEELCPRLRRLNVWDCAKINRSAAKSFRSRRPEVLLVLNNVAKQRS